MRRAPVTCLLVLVPALAMAQNEELVNPGVTSAIQDRAFKMAHEFSLCGGILPLDAFWKGGYPMGCYTLHFNDYFAWQVGRFAWNFPWSTGLRDQLERDFGVLPTAFDEVNFWGGSDLMLSPFYGKTTLFNSLVLHFDFHLLAGVSIFKFSTSGVRPAINLGGGIRLFQNQWVSWKFDVTNNIVITEKPFNVLTLTLCLAINLGGSE